MSIHSGWKSLATLSLVALVTSTFAAEPKPVKGATTATPKAQQAQTSADPRVRVTISKETTCITEPLRADGYPDYVAAINQRMSKGVTPENNFSVVFWKAMGPGPIKKEYREKHFQMLGILPLPEKGDYFVPWDAYLQKHESKDKHRSATATGDRPIKDLGRPWSKREYPLCAEYLEANEKPLALVAEACRRPRRFDPLICAKGEEELLMNVPLPGSQLSYEVARALYWRAMLQLNEGKVDEAWNDLLTCHRLARLNSQGATVVDGLVVLNIEWVATAGDESLLKYARLTATKIAKMRADFDSLPSIPSMADRLAVAERYALLDAILVVAREGTRCLDTVDDSGKTRKKIESMMDSFSSSTIDWDIPLTMVNFWFDRLAAACHGPTRSKRVSEVGGNEQAIRLIGKMTLESKSFGITASGNPRTKASNRVGQVFMATLRPSWSHLLRSEDRVAMQSRLTALAFALATYHAEHGSYPANLADLAQYVKELPKDIFNDDAQLRYSRQGDGYLLFSVGPNGKDDGGHRRNDRRNNEDWDDLTVRMTPAAP